MSDLAQAKELMLKEHLAARGINNRRVLVAFKEVPREAFVPAEMHGLAYADMPLEIGSGQTISQPYTVAFMTQLLDPKPTDIVLEVGTGSGYQAAILSRLVKKVYTIERFEELAKKAEKILRQLGYKNVEVIIGDGSKGLPAEVLTKAGLPQKSAFDGIIVTAGAPKIPQPLIDQLAAGGRLVIPVGTDTQTMTKIIKAKTPEGLPAVRQETFPGFRFVPLVGEYGFDE